MNVLRQVMAATFPITLADDGDSARLGTLFDAHHQRLYRLARRLSETPDEARDLVQETFLRAARSPRSIPDGPSQQAEDHLSRPARE